MNTSPAKLHGGPSSRMCAPRRSSLAAISAIAAAMSLLTSATFASAHGLAVFDNGLAGSGGVEQQGASSHRVSRRLHPAPGDCGFPCPLQPSEDMELDPGIHVFTKIDIPAGVTVHSSGPLSLYSDSTVDVEGTIATDCGELEVHGFGEVTILGTLDNRCSGDASDSGDLVIHTEGGSPITIGAPGAPAMLYSDGGLDVSNDSTLQQWQFDVMPFQRSPDELPPVCSAFSHQVSGPGFDDLPFSLQFDGEGADPDGGPVTYAWDFGDGETSTEQNPVHEFAAGGSYDVTLTVTDDDGESCVASGKVAYTDEQPVVMMAPADLVVAAGTPVDFTPVVNPDAALSWDFGDGTQATDTFVEHTYDTAGRYEISVQASDGGVAEATASVWVYTPPQEPPAAGVTAQDVELSTYINPVFTPDAVPGQSGHPVLVQVGGDLVIGGDTDIQCQSGGDAPAISDPDAGVPFAPRGAGLQLDATGHLTVQGGAHLATGDGAHGASSTPSGGTRAQGGAGGHGGYLNFTADSITVGSAAGLTTLTFGNGGAGGDATIEGLSDNREGCVPESDPRPPIIAHSGPGGEGGGMGGDFELVSLENVLLAGGRGGKGGDATATGGKGANSTCLGPARGVDGGEAEADATDASGGSTDRPRGEFNGVAAAEHAFEPGTGGNATATGGSGGNATSEPTAACAYSQATGGTGGGAKASPGRGGFSVFAHVFAAPGLGTATAGGGGTATATGTACEPCGAGGNADAFGGYGGQAEVKWKYKVSVGSPSGTAKAGPAGSATAIAGDGGACTLCAAGEGGAGGPATATGGRGGDAKRPDGNTKITLTGGKGGDATALGGDGGVGASCCDASPSEDGGKGGHGGNANATAGHNGAGYSGAAPVAAAFGGFAGDGGDGHPPGDPGMPGTPNGLHGEAGNDCPPTSVGEAWTVPAQGDPDARLSHEVSALIAGGAAYIFFPNEDNSASTLVELGTGAGSQSQAGALTASASALDTPSARRLAFPGVTAESVVALDDGSEVIGGARSGLGWMGRLMADGTLAWQQGVGSGYGIGYLEQADATKLLAAYNASSTVRVMRIGTDGTAEPAINLSRPTTSSSSSMSGLLPLADGGFLLSFTVGYNPAQTYVLRFDASDAIVWQVQFDRVYAGQPIVHAGSFYIVGTYQEPGGSTRDGWVGCLASDGSVVWQRTYGTSGSVSLKSLAEGPSGVLASGKTNADGETVVLQLADDGSVSGVHGFGGSGFIVAVGATSDGGVAVAKSDNDTNVTVIVTAPDLTVPGCADPDFGTSIDPGTIGSASVDAVVSTPTLTTSSVTPSATTPTTAPTIDSIAPTDACQAP
jgi:PKD repeat protein